MKGINFMMIRSSCVLYQKFRIFIISTAHGSAVGKYIVCVIRTIGHVEDLKIRRKLFVINLTETNRIRRWFIVAGVTHISN